MKYYPFIITIIGVTLITGCTTYPRFRSGGAELPAQVEPKGIHWPTSEYVRFGIILERYLGRPYQGRSKYDPGIDCSAFTREVFSRYDGTNLPRKARDQYKEGEIVHRRKLRFGDLVFFRTVSRMISHVGICVGHDQFVHASSSRGVIISSLQEKYWGHRYAGARRILK